MAIKLSKGWRENLTGYSIILPNFLGFLVFTSVPVFASFCLAFANWDIITPAEFIGFDNFGRLFHDPKFWKYLWNTMFLMSSIPLSMGLSLGMAMALNQKLRARTVFRTVFFLPTITAGVAIYIVWSRLLNKDFGFLGGILPAMPVWAICLVESGGISLAVGALAFLVCRMALDFCHNPFELRMRWFLLAAGGLWSLMALNVLLARWLGVPTFVPAASWIAPLEGMAGESGWLADPWLAKPSLVLLSLWASMGGYNMILYLAALQNVDPELYEAAEIDGAGRVQKFLNITWPLITPTTFFIFVTNCIHGFQGGFESAYIMTQGGPPSSGLEWMPWAGEAVGETTTLSYYIFNNAYVYLKMGYAAAMAWVLFLLVFAVTMVNWKYGGKRVEY